MPEDTTPTEVQATSVEDAPPAPAARTIPPDPQAGDGQEVISLEEARKLRRESQTLRKRLQGYEDAEKAQQEAQLSEHDRLSKRLADLQASHDAYVAQTQQRLVRYEVERQASKLGIIDPEAAAKLIDTSAFEQDEQGVPTNAEKLLKDLIKQKPYLAPPTEAPAESSPAQTATPNKTAPAVPAMNPGRSSIAAPGSLPPGKIPTLSDVFNLTRRQS